MLTDEMIQTAREHGAALGRTAAATLLERPKLAAKVNRLATAITKQFADLMKQGGLVDEDIEILCRTLRDAYRAELPAAADVTRH